MHNNKYVLQDLVFSFYFCKLCSILEYANLRIRRSCEIYKILNTLWFFFYTTPPVQREKEKMCDNAFTSNLYSFASFLSARKLLLSR